MIDRHPPRSEGQIPLGQDFPFSMLRSLRRHWLAAGAFFLCGLVILLAIVIVLPRKYVSEGKFFVLLGRGTVSLDPTATTGKNVNIQETRDAEINSVADILSSRALLEQVVDAIGTERILKSSFVFADWIHLPELELPSLSTGLSSSSVPAEHPAASVDLTELKRRDKAIAKLAANLKVRPTKKAATITISCRASSPWLAQEIARTLMTRYQDLHIKAHHTAGSYPFFEEQYRFHEQEMIALQEKLRDFKIQARIASLEGERNAVQNQMDRVALDLLQTQADLAAAQERARRLEEQYSALDPTIVSSTVAGNANEGADLMRDRLFSLEMREKELVARFNETHPEVRSVRESIEDARRVLADYPYDRKEITTAVNPTKLDLQGRWLHALTDVRSIEARQASLQAQQGELLVRLEALNRNEAQVEVLRKQLEIASANFRTYAQKLEEARINQALDAERISNVNVVQEPTFVVKPVSPKRSLLLLAGGMLLCLSSIMLAHLLEIKRGAVRTSDELVEKNSQTPVLATLPRAATRETLEVP